MEGAGIIKHIIVDNFISRYGSYDKCGFLRRDVYNLCCREKMKLIAKGDANTAIGIMRSRKEKDPWQRPHGWQDPGTCHRGGGLASGRTAADLSPRKLGFQPSSPPAARSGQPSFAGEPVAGASPPRDHVRGFRTSGSPRPRPWRVRGPRGRSRGCGRL
jgi:hypothetical protein